MDKKINDNSVHIGSGNRIKNSVIGRNIKVGQSHIKEKWYQNLIWKLIIPIVVAIVAAAICLALGIS